MGHVGASSNREVHLIFEQPTLIKVFFEFFFVHLKLFTFVSIIVCVVIQALVGLLGRYRRYKELEKG